MNLSDTVYKRKSVRKYVDKPVDNGTLKKILDFCAEAKPLYHDVAVRFEIVGKENVLCLFPWRPEHYLAVFSEEKDGYLENAGFLLQQADLFIQSMGLGSCWLGLSKTDSEIKNRSGGLRFVIMLCFGYPAEEFRKDVSEFKRKPLEKISDTPDARLEPARLAPSAVNTQPWYYTHSGNVLNVYRNTKALRHLFLKKLNRIDTGIGLAHMYAANTDTFRFFRTDAPALDGYDYVGSFEI